MNFFKLFSFVRYYFSAKHHKGHSVHSPFAYEFIANVVYAKYPYYAFRQLFLLRAKTITKNDHSSWKLDKLIFRTLQFSQPTSAIIADCNHLFTPFLVASIKKKMKVFAVDQNGCNIHSFSSFFGREVVGNIHSIPNLNAAVIDKLSHKNKIDFLLFDLHNNPEKVVELVLHYEQIDTPGYLIIVKNQYSSRESCECWRNLLLKSKAKVSMDVFEAGFLFYKPELQKQHYVVRF